MPSYTDGTNIITTESADAATFYAKGVSLLIAHSPAARTELRAAVIADDGLSVAHAALAVDARRRALLGECDGAITTAMARARGATRRERQHVEIVMLVLRGDMDRARALRAAHLAEFPSDALIAHLLG